MQTNEETKPDQPPSPPERSRRWKILVIVLIAHAAFLGGVVLIQGCGKSETPAVSDSSSATPASTEDKESPKDAVASEEEDKIIPPNSKVLTPEEQRSASAPVTDAATPAPSSLGPAPVKPEVPKKAETEAKNLASAESKTAPVASTTATPKAPVVATSAPAKKYIVAKGDTLSKIARKYGISSKELAGLNKLSAQTILKVGQKLTVPGKGQASQALVVKSATEPSSEASAPQTSPGQVHVVKAGESPVSIARQYGVSVTTLMELNHITDPRRMRVNQKLVIPGTKASGTTLTPAAAVGNEIQPTASEEPAASGKEVKGI